MHAALLGASPEVVADRGALVLGAFEPQEQGPLLRLELISNFPVPAAVTAVVWAGLRVFYGSGA